LAARARTSADRAWTLHELFDKVAVDRTVDMKVELFCLCDFASTDAGGKLNIIGVFDAIRAKSIPARHGPFSIAAKARFDTAEMGEKQFRIRLLSPEANDVFPAAEASINVIPSPDQQTATAQIALAISGTQLPTFGQYLVLLEIDNTPVASVPLYVKPFPAPSPTESRL
jgi:hypothetical protein